MRTASFCNPKQKTVKGDMFFKYRVFQESDNKLSLTKNTLLSTEGLTYGDFIKSSLSSSFGEEGEAISSLEWKIGFSSSVRKKIGDAYKKNDEAYAIVLGKVTRIFATSEKAFIYAAATLSQLARENKLSEGFLYDLPIGNERGYRAFLPARAGFEDFYRMVDFLATYKFNSIILEIGGAMEYRRHPKINETWAEFCRDMHRYSGRTKEIQFKTYPWPKNSIHCDNAGGDVLTQEECRTLAAYCRSRGLKVIPECPSLSHVDFLVLAYPELRERCEDGHPDTYCPRHPDVYTYVFDILEEVIDVFEPEAVHIGHDETYSIGICPRCKGTPAYKLYAEDVIKIYSFLKERGIKTYMWGEKLLNARAGKERIGGAGHGIGTRHVPALFPCRDLLPRDITYLHWYWRFNEEYDKVYHERGMTAVYGNLDALLVENWNKRRDAGINGGFVSNWGSFEAEYMQRNCQYFELFASAYAFWCDDFEEKGSVEVTKLCFEAGYRLRLEAIKNPFEITHTTTHSIRYEAVWDGIFITDEKYLLGRYELTYADGTIDYLPVRYGSHVGCSAIKNPVGSAEFRQLSYGVLPIAYQGAYAYRALYEDPHPDKDLVSISYLPATGREDIKVTLIGFTRGTPENIVATIDVKERGEADHLDGVQE